MEKALKYIREYHMIQEKDRIIAGISGGADSVCLLFVLKKLRETAAFTLEVVHVEHGIRGEESLADAKFTERLCQRLGVPFHLFSFDVPAEAKKKKMTMEEAARQCRYEAFREVCGEDCRAKIAVAHNQDDQAETILWNLVRGTGIRGLCGMKPVNGNIIRPLLGVSRQEIEEWLQEIGEHYRTDSTNLEDTYTRNKLRHQILPALEEGLNLQAKQHIASAGARLWRAEEYLEKEAEKKAHKIQKKLGEEIWINRRELLKEEEILKEYMIRYWLAQMQMGLKDIGAVHIEDIKQLAAKPSGKRLNLPENRQIRCTQEYLVFGRDRKEEKQEPEVPLTIPGETVFGKYRVITILEEAENTIIPENKYTKWMDYDTIKDTIYLRNRRSGDFFVATESGGRKKLKKFFIDEKVLQEERDQIPLLAEGSHILWIVGYRISQSCKVTSRTRQILKIQIVEEKNGR